MGGPAQLRARPVAGLWLRPETPGFFWCAGQGGFGIQTAPAAAALAAALLLGRPADPSVAEIDPERYAPDAIQALTWINSLEEEIRWPINS